MSPIYCYYCEKCKTNQEEMFSIKNRPDAITCKSCNGSAKYELSSTQFTVNGANAANKYSGDSNYRWMGKKD
jgi:putative FmdB family regulatory protein